MSDEDPLLPVVAQMEDLLRQVGVYDIDLTLGALGPRRLVMGFGTLGDVAFSTRVQHPELVDLDDDVTRLRTEQHRTDQQALRDELTRRALEGRSFFDDEGSG